jgi:hypothetical protein
MSQPDNPQGNISIQPDTLALKEKARQEGLEGKRRALGLEAR